MRGDTLHNMNATTDMVESNSSVRMRNPLSALDYTRTIQDPISQFCAPVPTNTNAWLHRSNSEPVDCYQQQAGLRPTMQQGVLAFEQPYCRLSGVRDELDHYPYVPSASSAPPSHSDIYVMQRRNSTGTPIPSHWYRDSLVNSSMTSIEGPARSYMMMQPRQMERPTPSCNLGSECLGTDGGLAYPRPPHHIHNPYQSYHGRMPHQVYQRRHSLPVGPVQPHPSHFGNSNGTGVTSGSSPRRPDMSNVSSNSKGDKVETMTAGSEDPEVTINFAPSTSFPVKLHYILSDPKYHSYITWLPHGKAWKILDHKGFERFVVPTFFRSVRYASFMRQVNGWGFRRILEGPDANSYYHKEFLRGELDLCARMKRPPPKKSSSFVSVSSEPDVCRSSTPSAEHESKTKKDLPMKTTCSPEKGEENKTTSVPIYCDESTLTIPKVVSSVSSLSSVSSPSAKERQSHVNEDLSQDTVIQEDEDKSCVDNDQEPSTPNLLTPSSVGSRAKTSQDSKKDTTDETRRNLEDPSQSDSTPFYIPRTDSFDSLIMGRWGECDEDLVGGADRYDLMRPTRSIKEMSLSNPISLSSLFTGLDGRGERKDDQLLSSSLRALTTDNTIMSDIDWDYFEQGESHQPL